MDITENSQYILVFLINNYTLTYKCIVTTNEDEFISFIDIEGHKYTYNKKFLISAKKIEDSTYDR